MAALEVRSFRNEDNSVSMVVIAPRRRNGEVNFGVIARINQSLLTINPDAFDPQPTYEEEAVQHHAAEAPMPPAMAAMIDLHAEDDTPEVAINWETAREHADGAA